MINAHLSFPRYEPKRYFQGLTPDYGQFCQIDIDEPHIPYPMRKTSSDVAIKIPSRFYDKFIMNKLELIPKKPDKIDIESNSDVSKLKTVFDYINRSLPQACFQFNLNHKQKMFISTLSVFTLGVITFEWWIFSNLNKING